MELEYKQDCGLALKRHQAFWSREVIGRPVMWVTAPNGKPPREIPRPSTPKERRTSIDYLVAARAELLRTIHFAGDALPTFAPDFGPSTVNAWMGGELQYDDNTVWVDPHVSDADGLRKLRLDREGWAWKHYLALLDRAIVEGKGRWVTGYPDLHTGSDALAAARGPEQFAMDMMDHPECVAEGMARMTDLWKEVVDETSRRILPQGQGTANWMPGWSDRRFVVVGHNDFTCMASPDMYREFFLPDNRACCRHVEHTLYHLDGPGALCHLDTILSIPELSGVQWVQGAGNGPMTRWMSVLKRIQAAKKCLHVTVDAEDVPVMLKELAPEGLFIRTGAGSAEEADRLVALAEEKR